MKNETPLLTNENDKGERNFLYCGIEVEARTGAAQVECIQDDGIVEGKVGTLSCLRLSVPPLWLPLWPTGTLVGYPSLPACLPKLLNTQETHYE